MLLIYKVMKILNSFLNGKWCFFCVICSMFITMMLFYLKMESNSKNATVIYNNYYAKNKQQMYITTMSTRKVTKSLNEMMKTVPEVNEDVIFFNSIPKSGGELLILLLQWLQDLNGFKHVRLLSPNKYKLSRYEQEDVVQMVINEVRNGALPFTFDRQMYFINFTSFGHQSPTYVSLVRDPIDKAIARFHFHRATPTSPLHYTYKSSRKTKLYHLAIEEFEKCVTSNEQTCTYNDGEPYDLTIPYFCGHEDRCRYHNDRWALNRAKENIERYYPVVGILEEVNTTLTLLEKKLPRFFTDVVNIYNKHLSKKREVRELQRPTELLSKNVKYILEKRLTTEYEFYYFVKKRLLSQRAIT